MASEDLAPFEHLVGYDSTSLRTIKDRYANVGLWGWQDGVLKHRDTLEPVSLDGEGPDWEYIVFLPGDVKYLLTQLTILSKAYDELFAIAAQTLEVAPPPQHDE